ncbi:hypothetical protein [Clostridium sp.]|uniref:hypothetical protein n=1 Tax=Clostridium sp. TaxID=1506 RepID=UPI003D6D252A
MGILIFIFLVLPILIIIIGVSVKLRNTTPEELANSKAMADGLNSKNAMYEAKVEYYGGHPDLLEAGKYTFKLFDDKIFIGGYTKDKPFEIPYCKIKGMEMVNKSQISNNPKLSSMLLFGIVGLGINNTDKVEEYFIILECEYKNKTVKTIFKIIDSYKDITSKNTAVKIYSMLNGLI